MKLSLLYEAKIDFKDKKHKTGEILKELSTLLDSRGILEEKDVLKENLDLSQLGYSSISTRDFSHLDTNFNYTKFVGKVPENLLTKLKDAFTFLENSFRTENELAGKILAKKQEKVSLYLEEFRSIPPGKDAEEAAANMRRKKAILVLAHTDLMTAWEDWKFGTNPPAQLALQMGEVLTAYGQLYYTDSNYANHFDLTRQLLLHSLNLQYYALGIVPECIDVTLPENRNLSKQPERLNNERSFESVHETILASSPRLVLRAANAAGLNEHARFVLAYTFRWIGGCISNIKREELKTNEAYTNLLMSALKLLTIEENPSKETADELVELRYNDLPSYYKNRIKDLDAYQENYKLLEEHGKKVKDYGLLARLYNKFFLDKIVRDDISGRKWLDMAIEARKQCLETQGNKFHLALLQNNLAKELLNQSPPQIEEARSLILAVRQHVVDANKNNSPHPYFSMFNGNYVQMQLLEAAIKIGKNNVKEAKTHLADALTVLKEIPENNDYNIDTQLLQQKYDELIQKLPK